MIFFQTSTGSSCIGKLDAPASTSGRTVRGQGVARVARRLNLPYSVVQRKQGLFGLLQVANIPETNRSLIGAASTLHSPQSQDYLPSRCLAAEVCLHSSNSSSVWPPGKTLPSRPRGPELHLSVSAQGICFQKRNVLNVKCKEHFFKMSGDLDPKLSAFSKRPAFGGLCLVWSCLVPNIVWGSGHV